MIAPQRLRQGWWAVGWLGVGAVIYLSLMHNPPTLAVDDGDKLQHVAAYGVLMLWFAQLTVLRRRRQGLAVALVALGVALEYAQLAIGYRDFSWADMVADALGVAVGWVLAPPRLPNLLTLGTQAIARNPG